MRCSAEIPSDPAKIMPIVLGISCERKGLWTQGGLTGWCRWYQTGKLGRRSEGWIRTRRSRRTGLPRQAQSGLPQTRRLLSIAARPCCGSDHSHTTVPWYRVRHGPELRKDRSSDGSGVGGGWGVLPSSRTHGLVDEHAERSNQGGCKEARAPDGHPPLLDAFDLIPQERHVILKNAAPSDASGTRYPSDRKKDLTLVDGNELSFVLSFGRHVKLAEAERARDGQTNPYVGSWRRDGSQRSVAETAGKQYQQCRSTRVLQYLPSHRQSLSSPW